MQIDGLTLIAQIVNLLILVWLLKRFLYQPIVNAVDKRQKLILAKMNEATDAKENALAEYAALTAEKNDFLKQKDKLMKEALHEIEALKKEQAIELSVLKENLFQKAHLAAKNEYLKTEVEIRNLVIASFMQLCQKVVDDFGSVSPIENAFVLFEKSIQNLSATEKKTLEKAALKTKEIQIESSQVLDKKQKEHLTHLLNKTLKLKEMRYHFNHNPTLILGFEAKIADMSVEWHLKAYLDDLQNNVNRALAEKLKM